VVRALENPGTDPTYLEFFGLKRPPFARLSRPSQIFHTEQYSLLMSHLATATEQSDCLVVICGADGSGKTTLLNRYITSLGDDICYVTIDETCNGEKKFYCAFLRQLGFSDITGTSRELWRITKEFLVHRGMAGDSVLLMIDNAHLINPTVLEQIRRISAIKVKDRRVLSIVLAGTSGLERIMDSPAMSQVEFHSHVHFNIRVYTEEETANYVWHRLRLAGGSDVVKFSNEAHPLIYRYTGGIPKLINMLCNDLLTEAYALESHAITEDLVRTVADNRRLLPHVVPLQGKGRRRTDPDFKLVQPDEQTGERITPRESTTKKPTPKAKRPDVGDKNLLEQISQLSEQIGEFRADRTQALEDLGTRDKEINELRNKLDAQTAESKKLTSALADHSDEIGRLRQALSDSTKALQKSERASKKLATDLEKERKAVKTAQTAETEKLASILEDRSDEVAQLKQALSDSTKALLKSEKASNKLSTDLERERKAANTGQTDISKANAKVEELGRLKSELQGRIKDLSADLKLADERVVEVDTLENNTAELKDEIEKKAGELLALRGELDSRDEAFGELEKLLQESQNESASLRLHVADLKNLEESVSEKDARIADLKAEVASYSQESMALEAKNEELESGDMELAQADDIPTLEVELQEVRQMLTGTQAQLTENSKSIAQPKTEARNSPKPENQLTARATASRLDSTAERSAGIITAFEVVRDGKIEQVMEIAEGQSRIMIGRGEDNELRLNSKFVSGHHALIFCTKKGLYIEDLNSSNGTRVNSRTITRCDLRAGDIVMIGDFQIRLRQS
jgi:type II secretory pathway predicted ATPase ExeA/septal ring factor EnvC (AmiA/AmiB activator)